MSYSFLMQHYWQLALGLFALLLLVWGLRQYLQLRLRLPTPFPEIPVRLVQVGEWSIRYHISGRGPHIVLLHGIGANLFCWRWLVPLLAQRFTVIAPDLPGFGQSSKLKSVSYGLDAQAERLRDFLNQIGVRNCLLVGNSMGGNIALWFTLRFPQKCLGTVVIAPATSGRLVPLTLANWHWLAPPISLVLNRRIMRWAHLRTVSKKDRVDQKRVEETFNTYGGQKDAVRSFIFATEAIRDPRLPQGLAPLTKKVLILWGQRDRMVPLSVISGLESALVAKETHMHPTGGHHLQEDEPEWVAEKIDAFAASLPD